MILAASMPVSELGFLEGPVPCTLENIYATFIITLFIYLISDTYPVF